MTAIRTAAVAAALVARGQPAGDPRQPGADDERDEQDAGRERRPRQWPRAAASAGADGGVQRGAHGLDRRRQPGHQLHLLGGLPEEHLERR